MDSAMTFNIDISSSIIAIVGFLIAYKQLKKLGEQLELSTQIKRSDSLKIVLEIESQMATRKVEFDKIAREIEENINNEEKLIILNKYFDSSKESYFNSFDRLCYCIDKKYLDDRDWKVEYRNTLKDLIDLYPNDFNEASPFRNIKKINQLGQSE